MRGPGGFSFRAGGKLAVVAEVGAGEQFGTIRQGVLYVMAVDQVRESVQSQQGRALRAVLVKGPDRSRRRSASQAEADAGEHERPGDCAELGQP